MDMFKLNVVQTFMNQVSYEMLSV